MIGDGWDGEPSLRPDVPGIEHVPALAPGRARVCVVTGSRADFGLLAPVMQAIASHEKLELAVVAAGSHLISPATTFREVKAHFAIAEIVPMQVAGQTGRFEDVQSVAKGVARFGRAFERLAPSWVLVLGDRIEAFAAASAASIGGVALAHVHGGDRAEGVADEAMRHAITKLAHLHFAATKQSGARIEAMGEDAWRVRVVGSPAIDALGAVQAMHDEQFAALGSPEVVLLLHPIGRSNEQEEAQAAGIIEELRGLRVLALMPNSDPGREGIARAIADSGLDVGVRVVEHLPRETFLALLARRPVVVGNSSAALIECAALRVPAVDIGPRQAGRERCGNVVHVSPEKGESVRSAVKRARELDLSGLLSGLAHPYGDGRAGVRIAQVLAEEDARREGLIRKRCTY